MEDMREKLCSQFNFDVYSSKFVEETLKALYDSRNFLRWTYIYLYFLIDNSKKEFKI